MENSGPPSPAAVPDAAEIVQPVLHLRQRRALGPLDFITGIVVFVLSMAVYVATLAPTVYGEDSGELIAAAYTLGIPHPAGYPLWCLLAKLFMVIVPSGEMAWRANLMSAVFGAGTAMLTSLLICMLVRNRVAAFAGALSLAFSRELWEQSVIAEVYTLNAFFTALCLLFLVVWGQTRQNWLLYACGALFGIGLTNHHVLLLATPAFACYALLVAGMRWRAWTMHLIALVCALAGLAFYLYLPIRSAANPAMDWGNPETWAGFVDVVTRAQYQFIITDSPRTWARFIGQWNEFGHIYLKQFTIGVGLIAPFGAVVLWRRGHRAVCTMLVLLWVCNVLGSILIPNYGTDRMSIWLNTTYWIPAYLVAAILLGAVIAGVCSATPRAGVRVIVATGLCIAAIGAPLIAHYERNDKSDYYLAADYARNILSTLAPGAVYFGDSDLALFPVMYYQIVERMRTDVLIANPYGYPIEAAYSAMPEEVTSRFARIPTQADEQLVFEWLVKYGDRPVYTTAQRRVDGVQVWNKGLLYRYAPEGVAVSQSSPWDLYTWRTLDEAAFEDDWSAEVILFEYYFARGRAAFDAGQRAAGINDFERAAQIARANKEALNNLGCAAAEYGFYDTAARLFRAACALDPGFHMARMNLGRAYMKQGDYQRAHLEFLQVLEVGPDNATARALMDFSIRQGAGPAVR
ncbi:MAG: DUF2723 domain-containing protein [Candidatus Hydrogenedentes bacterium]|nr:DUF2723 domain-containing protein [Candidatus Hydrogenedentota bacterium]